MSETKEKSDETLLEKDAKKRSFKTTSQTVGTKIKRENEASNENKHSTETKYSKIRKHSSEPESSKKIKLDTEQNLSNTSNENKHSTETKYSKIRKHSSEPESSKKIKLDTEQNLSNTSADQSADDKKEIKEIKQSVDVKICNDNTVVVAKHYNSLQAKNSSARDESRILYMRNFNNWIKSMLIYQYINKTRHKVHGSHFKVMDMCCGKGGDLFKWKKMNVTHLICTDLAEVTVQHCQDRYKAMLERRSKQKEFSSIFTAEFITADCTKDRLRTKFRDPSVSLDLVSCQFAFHYCFESLQQAERMLRNASECLRPGGYFIGTIPDAYDLVWQKCDGNSFGNDIYDVEFLCDKTKPPLFGAKYHFQLEGVVNCPEFLVYLPVFSKLALKFGLELELFERFDDFYEHTKYGGRSLLSKIQALETYSPYREGSLVGNPKQDYQHAKQYMQSVSKNCEIGTLSQPEWEVASLYAVFAFKKMKFVWNNGKQEYIKS